MKNLLIISMLAAGLLPITSFADNTKPKWATCPTIDWLNPKITDDSADIAADLTQYPAGSAWQYGAVNPGTKLKAMTSSQLIGFDVNNLNTVFCAYNAVSGENITFKLDTSLVNGEVIVSPDNNQSWQRTNSGDSLECDSALPDNCPFRISLQG